MYFKIIDSCVILAFQSHLGSSLGRKLANEGIDVVECHSIVIIWPVVFSVK